MNQVFCAFCLVSSSIVSICLGYDFGPEDIIVDQLQHDEIIKIESLQNELVHHGKIAKSKHDLLYVELKSGIAGVFKPSSQKAIFAEVAAYRASHALGFSLVPPTVIRTIKEKCGSFQLFINTNVDPMVKGTFDYAIEHADPDEIATLKIFYYVFGQWDFRKRNILINAQKDRFQFIAIDNEVIWHRIFWRYGDNAFVARNWSGMQVPKTDSEFFPYDNFYTIMYPTRDILVKKFGSSIPYKYIRWFGARNPLNYVYFQDSLWIKFEGDVSCFAYTTYFPEETIRKLKQLDYSLLYEIFSHAQGAAFLTEEYVKSILDRRDQVLESYEQRRVSDK